MQTTLYHYVHCPYCLRVRFGLGFFQVPYKSVVLGYDDEQTPTDLMQKKMLPIVAWEDGAKQNESLDILERLDRPSGKLRVAELKESGELEKWDKRMESLGGPIHSLVMPYWVHSQEFSETAKTYFLSKKEKKRGPFNELMAKRQELENSLVPLLRDLEAEVLARTHLDAIDIIVASHIWGLYMLPEFQFSPPMHEYLQRVKTTCHFDYHMDYKA